LKLTVIAKADYPTSCLLDIILHCAMLIFFSLHKTKFEDQIFSGYDSERRGNSAIRNFAGHLADDISTVYVNTGL
jgi:hypothetical protein